VPQTRALLDPGVRDGLHEVALTHHEQEQDRDLADHRGRHLVLLPVALLKATPLIWMVITSVSTLEETRRFPPSLPSGLEWANYATTWTGHPAEEGP